MNFFCRFLQQTGSSNRIEKEWSETTEKKWIESNKIENGNGNGNESPIRNWKWEPIWKLEIKVQLENGNKSPSRKWK